MILGMNHVRSRLHDLLGKAQEHLGLDLWKCGKVGDRLQEEWKFNCGIVFFFADSLILAFVRFRDGVAGNGDVAHPGFTVELSCKICSCIVNRKNTNCFRWQIWFVR